MPTQNCYSISKKLDQSGVLKLDIFSLVLSLVKHAVIHNKLQKTRIHGILNTRFLITCLQKSFALCMAA